MAWELCSKSDVTTLHPVNASELEDLWSETVEGMIRQHLGTPDLGSSQSITAEVHNGDDTVFLRVKKPPIISVSDIRINGASVTASQYIVHDNHIQLEIGQFPDGNANVQVDYVSGSSVIHPTVKLAAATMIVAFVTYNRRAGADSSVKWSSSTETKSGEDTPTKDLGLHEHLNAIMKQLLRRPVPRVHM